MKQAFAPADDIADGEMYLRLAADMDRRIGELKARYTPGVCFLKGMSHNRRESEQTDP